MESKKVCNSSSKCGPIKSSMQQRRRHAMADRDEQISTGTWGEFRCKEEKRKKLGCLCVIALCLALATFAATILRISVLGYKILLFELELDCSEGGRGHGGIGRLQEVRGFE